MATSLSLCAVSMGTDLRGLTEGRHHTLHILHALLAPAKNYIFRNCSAKRVHLSNEILGAAVHVWYLVTSGEINNKTGLGI